MKYGVTIWLMNELNNWIRIVGTSITLKFCQFFYGKNVQDAAGQYFKRFPHYHAAEDHLIGFFQLSFSISQAPSYVSLTFPVSYKHHGAVVPPDVCLCRMYMNDIVHCYKRCS